MNIRKLLKFFKKIIFLRLPKTSYLKKQIRILFNLYIIKFGYLRYYNIKKGDYIVDCGAFEGLFTRYASKRVGKNGLVLAFEPNLKYFETLRQLKVRYNLGNVLLINKGLWCENKKISFDPKTLSIRSKNQNLYKLIEVTTLDSELKKRNINKIDFIKMDIEGAEIKAIQGAENILKEGTNLAIASYHLINGKMSFNRLESLIESFGYKTKTKFSIHLTTYAFK